MIPFSIENPLALAAIAIGIGVAWLVGINIVTFRALADDKTRAVYGWKRLPEYRLLNLASMGGSIGAMLAQRIFCHKTRKQPFAGQLRQIAITQAILLLIGTAAILMFAGSAAAASGFACAAPTHHDGDAIRCAGAGRSDRMFGIDAPEMPGACRPGRRCTPGDPFAARDHLAALTRGRSVTCEQTDTDAYGRRVVRCTADGIDLSCAMVADGYAVERYGRLNCAGGPSTAVKIHRPQRLYPNDLPGDESSAAGEAPQRRIYPADLVVDAPPPTVPTPQRTKLAYLPSEVRSSAPVFWLAGAWLATINIAAYAAFAIDKNRATARRRAGRRVPEAILLVLASIGGTIGAVVAQQSLPHKVQKQPFAGRLLLIVGIQIGAIIGCALLLR